jgi:hypothetical protein
MMFLNRAARPDQDGAGRCGPAERKDRRPNTAPAYYLGHPAAVWITAMRPRAAGSSLNRSGTALSWAAHLAAEDELLGGLRRQGGGAVVR